MVNGWVSYKGMAKNSLGVRVSRLSQYPATHPEDRTAQAPSELFGVSLKCRLGHPAAAFLAAINRGLMFGVGHGD
jgi:hypothetical protein